MAERYKNKASVFNPDDYKQYLDRDYSQYPVKRGELLNKEMLQTLYIDCNLSKPKIAKVLNCKLTYIKVSIKKHGIIKPVELISASKIPGSNKTELELQKWKQQTSENTKRMWLTMPEDQRKIVTNRMSAKAKDILNHQTKEQKQHRIEQFKKTWYSSSEEEKQLRNKHNSESKKEWWKNASQEVIEKRSLKRNQTMENKTDEEKLEIQEKIYNTKKKNGSLNTSKQEKEIEQILRAKFNVIPQYKCEKFPFACDFYVPELDLFIDYNEMWTHGGEPFNKCNPKHIEKLNMWKSKNTKFYNNAIYTWTDLDVRKAEVTKQNNLNRIIFYTLEEFKHWWEGHYGS